MVDGIARATYRRFANAANGVAWWLRQSLGLGQNFDTLAYFGRWNIRYILLLLAAVKAGYKISQSLL